MAESLTACCLCWEVTVLAFYKPERWIDAKCLAVDTRRLVPDFRKFKDLFYTAGAQLWNAAPSREYCRGPTFFNNTTLLNFSWASSRCVLPKLSPHFTPPTPALKERPVICQNRNPEAQPQLYPSCLGFHITLWNRMGPNPSEFQFGKIYRLFTF